jgi:hypothetical protein
MLTYYRQRDGIVKSLEELIPQAQLAFHARHGPRKAANQGPECRSAATIRRCATIKDRAFRGGGASDTEARFRAGNTANSGHVTVGDVRICLTVAPT